MWSMYFGRSAFVISHRVMKSTRGQFHSQEKHPVMSRHRGQSRNKQADIPGKFGILGFTWYRRMHFSPCVTQSPLCGEGIGIF